MTLLSSLRDEVGYVKLILAQRSFQTFVQDLIVAV